MASNSPAASSSKDNVRAVRDNSRKAAGNKFEEIHNKVTDYIYKDAQDIFWKRWLEQAESKTKVDRVYMAYGVGAIVALYMIIGGFAELICNGVGFALPAYRSMLAIRSPSKTDDTRWLVYWTVFGVFCLFDFASESIMGYFPFYWLIKCVFFIWMQHEDHSNKTGAEKLWKKSVEPVFEMVMSKVNKKSQ